MWKNTKSDSVWLTSYILQLLSDAREFIEVDEKLIEDSIKYLEWKQGIDGSFDDKNVGNYRNLVPALSKTYLTSFVALGLIKNYSVTKSSVDKAVNYLINQSNNMEYDYDLIIAAYALTLANKKYEADKLFKKIKRNYKTVTHPDKEAMFIEIASYDTLLNLHKNNIMEALEAVKWLINHRVKNGGFPSSFDSYMGLNAIASFLIQSGSVDGTGASLDISTNNGMQTLDVNNVLDIAKKELMGLENNTEVNLQFNGNGLIYANFWYQYAVIKPTIVQNFYPANATIEILTQNENVMDITLKSKTNSTMVVMEVSLPSGFIYLPGNHSKNVKVKNNTNYTKHSCLLKCF